MGSPELEATAEAEAESAYDTAIAKQKPVSEAIQSAYDKVVASYNSQIIAIKVTTNVAMKKGMNQADAEEAVQKAMPKAGS